MQKLGPVERENIGNQGELPSSQDSTGILSFSFKSIPMHRYSRDEMMRRKRIRTWFVKKHIDWFIKVDAYALEHEIRLPYEWYGYHLENCAAAKFLLTELRKYVYYYPVPNNRGTADEILRRDIWIGLHGIWKKRYRKQVENYEARVERARLSMQSAGDGYSNVFP